MKKLLPFNYWTVSLQGDTAVIGIFEDAGAIHWDAVDPLNLPQDLIGVENGKLCWLQPGGVADFARQLERQRDELAEALREMRYGHTDKAERMAAAALSYLENVQGLAPPTGSAPSTAG